MAKDTYATIEELLEMVFSIPFMRMLGNEDQPDQASVVMQNKYSINSIMNTKPASGHKHVTLLTPVVMC
jgi:hypothetical protein